jgi:hypothetical protein
VSQTGRLTTKRASASYATWDPADQEPFRALAGSQIARVEGSTAVVRLQDGHEVPVYEGWLVVRLDGTADGEALFTTPQNVGDDPSAVWDAA